jgi:hypothetical protein
VIDMVNGPPKGEDMCSSPKKTEVGNPPRAVIVLEYVDPDPDLFFRVAGALRDYMSSREDIKPDLAHLGIREVAEDVLGVFEREVNEMALRKHGEGEVIPETDQQQKTAGMSAEARVELDRENEEADGGLGSGSE